MKEYKNEYELKKDYPIQGTIEGWYFRITEMSANVYLIEGQSLKGASISRQCTEIEVDNALNRCNAEARQIEKD